MSTKNNRIKTYKERGCKGCRFHWKSPIKEIYCDYMEIMGHSRPRDKEGQTRCIAFEPIER